MMFEGFIRQDKDSKNHFNCDRKTHGHPDLIHFLKNHFGCYGENKLRDKSVSMEVVGGKTQLKSGS